MPFDGSGNFTRSYNFSQDKINGIKIVASRMDGEFDNYAAALNQTFMRNGVVPMTGSLNMGTNTINSLGSGVASTPAVRFNADTTSGLFLPGFNQVSLSAGGVERLQANTTGVGVTGTLAVTGGQTISSTLNVTGVVTHANSRTYFGKDGSNTHWFASTDAVAEPNNLAYGFAANGTTITSHTFKANGSNVLVLNSSGATLTGAATISSTLGVTGIATFGTNINQTGGTATLNAGYVNTTLQVVGATTLSTVGTNGLATLNSASITNNATVGGTLGVTGATTLSSAGITGNATVGGTLGITGLTTLAGASNSGTYLSSATVGVNTSTDQGQHRLRTTSGRGWRMGHTSVGATLGIMYIQGTTDDWATSFIESIATNASGQSNIGGGTTGTFSGKLNVQGDLYQAGGSGVAHVLGDNTNGWCRITNASNVTYVQSGTLDSGAASPNAVVFAPMYSNAEWARIFNGGVLIGTTSATNVGGGGGVNQGIFFDRSNPAINAQNNAASILNLSKASGYTANTYAAFYNAGTGIGSISTPGGASIAYNTTSDRNAKFNIEDADDSGPVIDALRVRKFNMRVNGYFEPYGLIAQEAHNAYPNPVTVPSNPSDYWAVDYGKYTPLLIKEVQSLRARLSAAGL